MGYTDKAGIRTIEVEGLIGETSDFFLTTLSGIKEIHMNLKNATYMNSVGVKHWVNWASKIPAGVKVILKRCPSMIANQASMVVGFLPANFSIETFFAPFVCPECEGETLVELKSGEHYKMAEGADPYWFSLPEPICGKCPTSPKLETDFLPEKLFRFLKPS